MATICPYCNIEVSESLIEAEDGCCPECGAVISATSSFLGDDFESEYEDENDIFGDFEDDDDIFQNEDLEDDIFDDEFGDEFDDEEFKEEEENF